MMAAAQAMAAPAASCGAPVELVIVAKKRKPAAMQASMVTIQKNIFIKLVDWLIIQKRLVALSEIHLVDSRSLGNFSALL